MQDTETTEFSNTDLFNPHPSGFYPLEVCPVYTAAAHGIIGFTRSMAVRKFKMMKTYLCNCSQIKYSSHILSARRDQKIRYSLTAVWDYKLSNYILHLLLLPVASPCYTTQASGYPEKRKCIYCLWHYFF